MKRQYVKPKKTTQKTPFAGLNVYAASDCVERYFDTLIAYTDSDMAANNFTEVIDHIINYVCERIRDGGKKIIKSEFSWASDVSLYFHKQNKSPGKWTRVFFVSDWKSEITIYDVTTPEEHHTHLSSYGGRYKSIHDGDVAYDFDPDNRTQIKTTIADILDD